MEETLIRNIPISVPDTGIEEWEAVKEPLMTGWLTSGPKVRAFEEGFSKIHNVHTSVAVTSATTALHLALVALGIKEGDEVIVPAFTWVSTANVVLYCGAKPVFCDIDTKTFNIDPEKLSALVNENTKAIIPVHLFGLCADMDAIKKVAPGIPLVEDGACAAGAAYKGIYAGGLGDIGCFSFHPRKSITCGEGGMCTTNNPELGEQLAILRNHGASVSEEARHHGPRPHILPEFELMGFNYRMTDLQGAVALVQLGKLEQYIAERNEWAQYYIENLKDVEWLTLPDISSDYKHGWQSFVTLVDENKAPFERNIIMDKLKEKGIATRPGTHAVHMLKFYREKYNIQAEDFPEAKRANNYSMAIPLHNRMVKEDFDYIIEAIKFLA